MDKSQSRKIISVTATAVICAIFIVVMYFCSPTIPIVPQTSGELTFTHDYENENGEKLSETITAALGKDLAAVRICDMGTLGKVTKVNYVPDRFLHSGELSQDIQIVDLTKPFKFAKKGTLIFIFANLDPYSSDFKDRVDALAPFKMGDDWHFTLSLPEIFCASNIYYRAQLIESNGQIENYDFSTYSLNYKKTTDTASFATATTYIDLSFYTRREALEDTYRQSQIITIHYQSDGGYYSGIKDAPLIGEESAVKGIEQNSQNLLLSVVILSIVVLAVLIVLSIVEKSVKFVSAIVWVTGVSIMLFSRFIMGGATSSPLLFTAISLSVSFVILGGALFAMCKNIGKVPLKIILPALSGLGALLAFLCPFIPYEATVAMRTVCTAIKAVCVFALISFITMSLIKKDDSSILQVMCTAIIAVAIVASLFMPQIFPAQLNPMFYLNAALSVCTFVGVVWVIMDMKRSNVYLTENLHKEVDRQIADIKAVIDDRDKLLQFVSHDMKKPLASAVALCDTAIERASDAEQIKTISIIRQDANRVIDNLSKIGAYARFNFIAEPSKVINMQELCALLYKYHEFDCSANGIILKNNVTVPAKAFVKQKALENVVSNIIINAIEHACCQTVTLSLKSVKNNVILCIADDGKGIAEDIDIFKPYISENKTETGGVGLYICKNMIESMNGQLTYESDDGGSTFFIQLLKA